MALDVGYVPSTIQASDNEDGNFIGGIANNLLFNHLDMHSLSTFSTITSATSTGKGESINADFCSNLNPGQLQAIEWDESWLLYRCR
nr:hypothetical protein CFP56_77095 [Quercus suber]